MEKLMDTNKAKKEISWVIKMVESVQTKEQLDTALKCYFLWEIKYPSIKNMKSEFWASFKNKESQISFPENPVG